MQVETAPKKERLLAMLCFLCCCSSSSFCLLLQQPAGSRVSLAVARGQVLITFAAAHAPLLRRIFGQLLKNEMVLHIVMTRIWHLASRICAYLLHNSIQLGAEKDFHWFPLRSCVECRLFILCATSQLYSTCPELPQVQPTCKLYALRIR